MKRTLMSLSIAALLTSTPLMAMTPEEAVAETFGVPAELLSREDSPMDGFDIVSVADGADFLLVSKDGRYILYQNDVMDVENKSFVMKTIRDNRDVAQQPERVEIMAALEQDLIVYPTQGETKASITVFTDPTCPYCRKLHAELDALSEAGIEVRYALFPRSGMNSPVAEAMAVMLTRDKVKSAFDMAFEKGDLTLFEQDDEHVDKAVVVAMDTVSRFLEAGNAAGLQGTPFIVLEDGRTLEGYRPAEQMIQMILGE